MDKIFTAKDLKQFTKSIFLKMDFSQTHAEIASDALITADLRGIDSHGVARLSGYVRLWKAGRINPKPKMEMSRQMDACGTLDGDAGIGLVTASKAMDIAIEKAKITGLGMISVKNSNHFGIAAYHASKALKHNMIGIAMTNASPLVVPTFSKERMLGTNPICYVFPAKKYNPLVFDMATSAAANGKLQIAERLEKPIPKGWAVDKDGNPSENPSELKLGGGLLTLGSQPEIGSHKGYGLAAIVDLLSGVLSGANFGPWVPPFVAFLPLAKNPVGEGIGHFLGAIRVDAFRPLTEYFNAIDTWIERFKASEPQNPNQKVMVHGEPETAYFNKRKENGIPVNKKVVDDLLELAREFEVSFSNQYAVNSYQ